MARTSTFPLYDRASGGGLKQRLRAMRRKGMTYEQIAAELRNEGIDVASTTVFRWCRSEGIEQKQAS